MGGAGPSAPPVSCGPEKKPLGKGGQRSGQAEERDPRSPKSPVSS